MKRAKFHLKLMFGWLCLLATPAFAVLSSPVFGMRNNCVAIAERDISLCKGLDCKGVLANDRKICASNDCRAMVDGEPRLCLTKDCRAYVAGDAALCDSKACRAVISRTKKDCP